jgi:Reverse transcriptase (RNA-dependent DNA polymerase)
MKNIIPIFEEWAGTPQEAKEKLVGYQFITCHMIFDIKMENFTRKARFVAGGHTTEPPSLITYSMVVTRDSVRIGFLLAGLDQLQVRTADVGNAYLTADCREKIWTIAGSEFGSRKGKVMIIKKALYGLKSSGAAWRAHFAQSLNVFKFTSTEADPDMWIQMAQNGYTHYCERMFVYVDDLLLISHDPDPTMAELGKMYRLKPESMGEPHRYLGANVGKQMIPDGCICWWQGAKDYLTAVITNLERQLQEKHYLPLNKRAARLMRPDYRPEMDISELLEDHDHTWFMELIGILHWSCELGRIDVLVEVTMLSSSNACPRLGHLYAVFKVFAYLKAHLRGRIVFDWALPQAMLEPLYEQRFESYSWLDFYGDIQEEIPPEMPPPLGSEVRISCFDDADHASDLASRRSHSGILIFLNNAPIIWFSKKQNSVQSATFGSEITALKIAVELIEALRYKLRMFGVRFTGPCDVFCDNQRVVHATTNPASRLSKKNNSISYHKIRAAIASRVIRITKEPSETNLAAGLTKPMSAPRRKQIFSNILYGVYWTGAGEGQTDPPQAEPEPV